MHIKFYSAFSGLAVRYPYENPLKLVEDVCVCGGCVWGLFCFVLILSWQYLNFNIYFWLCNADHYKSMKLFKGICQILIFSLKIFSYFRIRDYRFADCNPVNFVNTEVANVIAYFLCALSQDVKRDLCLSTEINKMWQWRITLFKAARSDAASTSWSLWEYDEWVIQWLNCFFMSSSTESTPSSPNVRWKIYSLTSS